MIALWWLAWAWAAEPTWTLADVLASVEAHHPKIVAAQAGVVSAQASRRGAEGWWDPVLTVDGAGKTGPYDNGALSVGVRQATPLWGLEARVGYGLGLGDFAAYDGDAATLSAGEIRVGATLPLLRGGPTDASRTAVVLSQADLDAAQAKLAAQRIDTFRDARVAWAKWVAAGEKRVMAQGMLDAAVANARGVARRIEHGDLAPFDQIDADRVVSERAIKVMELDAELAVAAAKLSVYLRDAEGVPIRITDAPPPRTAPPPLPDASREETLATALVLRPEILLLEAKAEAADAKVRLARTYVLPKLDAKVDVAQPLNVSDPAFKGTEVKFGGTLSAPLPMRAGRGALDAANADRQVVDAERRWVADNVAAELDGAWARLVAADRRLAEAERLVTLAREVEMATRTAFELGDRTLFDLYLREQNRLKTELDRADIAFEREAAAADWLAAQGRVEDGSSPDTATR
ncbi:MAG: hypothetical protein RLZZ383_382 [Pseudomonadota bacterium]